MTMNESIRAQVLAALNEAPSNPPSRYTADQIIEQVYGAQADAVMRRVIEPLARQILQDAAEQLPGSTSANPLDPYDRVAEWLIERSMDDTGS